MPKFTNKPVSIVYVTNTDSDDISVVDPKARTEKTRIQVGGSPRGAVKFDRPKTFGYVSNCAGNTISVIDLHRNREVSRVTVGLAPRGIAISDDGHFAFVSNSGSNTLSVVDLNLRKQIREIAMGGNPRHMAVLPNARAVLVSIWGSDSVAIVDYSGGSESVFVSKSVKVGADARPYSITIDSKGNRGYVANTQADYMSIIDPKAGKEIGRVTVGFGGRAIALSPDEKYAFISVENQNEIAVIDLAKKKVVRSVKVGPSPRGIAIDKVSLELYSAGFSRSGSLPEQRNTISVVDVSTPTKARHISDIKVGLGPCSVSVLS